MALRDITLGQYFPGKSPIHRLDPRAKLTAMTCYIVALFLAQWLVTYGVLLAVLAGVVAASTVKLKALLRGMKPVVFILVFTALLNILYTPGEPLVSFWIFNITREGIVHAVFMVVRILMLISCTFLLTYTTSPLELTDGLESLLGPLKAVRVPVHELSMMMSIALRFIPTLIEETDKIMSAQRARGADFDSGNLAQRAKALIPLLVPLLPGRGGPHPDEAAPLPPRGRAVYGGRADPGGGGGRAGAVRAVINLNGKAAGLWNRAISPCG